MYPVFGSPSFEGLVSLGDKVLDFGITELSKEQAALPAQIAQAKDLFERAKTGVEKWLSPPSEPPMCKP